MRLSDLMSAMQLSAYAEVGLVIFLVTFLAIVLHVMNRKRAPQWEAARHMPLDDELVHTPFVDARDDEGAER